jgi:molybdenum cofactor cytidylyltransferase
MRAGVVPVAAVILAAGAATRMGKLKQLLPYRGRTLVQNSIQQAIEAGFKPVIVVVGAQSEAVRKAVSVEPVDIIENHRWESGMGSSLVTGVKRLQEIAAGSAGVAILLPDQPLVGAKHLSAMRHLFIAEGAPVVAAEYADTLGVPALFAQSMFSALTRLPASAGARALLRGSGLHVVAFPLPEAAIDIDTPNDFTALSGCSRRTP